MALCSCGGKAYQADFIPSATSSLQAGIAQMPNILISTKRIYSKKNKLPGYRCLKESSGPLDPGEIILRGALVFIFDRNLIKLWWR